MQTVTDVAADGRMGGAATRLLAAATLSRLADSAAGIAVTLLVIARTDDVRLAGLVVAAFALPTLLTGPILGALLDRLPAKRPLFIANQLILAATLTGVLVLAGRSPTILLIALGLLAGLTAPVLTGGYSSILPQVLPPARLTRGNAADAASYNIAGLGGPALASAIASTAGAGAALASVAAIAAIGVALILIAPMPTTSAAVTTTTAAGGRESLPTALRDGVRLVMREPLLRATTVTTTVSHTVQGLLPVTLPLLALQLGHPAEHGGWILTAISFGALIGSLASAHLLIRIPPRTALIGALVCYGSGVAAIAAAPTLSIALPFAALAGLANGPVLAATMTIRQHCTPAHRYAQIVATGASIKTGGYALGAATTGLLAAHLTARQIVFFVAGVQLLALVPLLTNRQRIVPPHATPKPA
ncbi:MFS transporter [Micromonospora sp. STR1s_6]|uniref:MFS transporter n=2 Tax=Micromonospora tarensis TaxID=2806100 RepID=A0ABS1YJ00_9ACTN|nr:MFS transporter [Micromonospora tarensis]